MAVVGIGFKGGHSPRLPLHHHAFTEQKFMPPADLNFACRDISEIPREKVVAYTRALQHWAEQNNLPAGGEPCLLAKNVLELREEVKWYLSFTDEEVFQGIALPEKEEGIDCRPFAPQMYPRHIVHLSQPLKGESQSFWNGRKCYTHPNQW